MVTPDLFVDSLSYVEVAGAVVGFVLQGRSRQDLGIEGVFFSEPCGQFNDSVGGVVRAELDEVYPSFPGSWSGRTVLPI